MECDLLMIKIEKVINKKDLKAFIAFPSSLYPDDPNWIPPLFIERSEHLSPLDQKQQETLENNVFTQLNKTYKTPEAFQDYGVMYWRDNQLHVALKSNSDLDTVKANLASQGNATINNYVVVEPSQYSQTEYDVIESNFRSYYSKNEKGGNIIAVFPDVENNQLYAVVSTASKETQQGISKVFGSKVKMTVKR